jgi:hypothetical protein
MTFGGKTSTGTVSGTIKVKGNDVAVTSTSHMDGKTETSETRDIGETVYRRTNGGEWTTTARDVTDGASIFDRLAYVVLQDKGLASFHGKSLHKLAVTQYYSLDSSLPGVNYIGHGVDASGVELNFWAKTDGTPAGMTFHMLSGSGSDSMEITLEYTFDKLSGVTITAPNS